MGDSPVGFTKADAAWRMRLAKWVEPAKPSAEHVRRWVNFGTQPLHVGDSGSTGNPSKKIFQILWCSSWIIQPIFNLWPAPALAGIGNKALSAVDLAWPGWDFWPNSNVRNLKKSQKQSQGTKCIKISAQIIRMSTLDVREGRSPSRSCLHFAYLGGSSNEHQGHSWGAQQFPLTLMDPQCSGTKLTRAIQGHLQMSGRATTDLKRRRFGVLSDTAPRAPRSSSVCDFWAAATFQQGERLDVLGVKNIGKTPK